MQIEKQAANAVLDRGMEVLRVSAPFLLRLVGVKVLRFIIRRPCYGTLQCISAIYAGMGIPKLPKELDVDDAHTLFNAHGNEMLKIIATAYVDSFFFNRIAFILMPIFRWNLDAVQVYAFWYTCVKLNGLENFPNTIRLVEKLTVSAPILSQN